jgi:hypothetical protein
VRVALVELAALVSPLALLPWAVAVSETAMRQPRALLKMIRCWFWFMVYCDGDE